MARVLTAALAASLVLQVSCLNVPSRGALPRMRRAARQPLPVLLTEVKDEEFEVWRVREEIMRGVYGAVVNWKEDEREEREERLEEGNESGADAKSAFVASAAAVVVGAFILRLGGRAALVSVLGLDVVADLGLGDQINDVVSYANALGGWAVVGFFMAWVVAKVFLLDVRRAASPPPPTPTHPHHHACPMRHAGGRHRARLRIGHHLRRRLRGRHHLGGGGDARLARCLPAEPHTAAGGH